MRETQLALTFMLAHPAFFVHREASTKQGTRMQTLMFFWISIWYQSKYKQTTLIHLRRPQAPAPRLEAKKGLLARMILKARDIK